MIINSRNSKARSVRTILVMILVFALSASFILVAQDLSTPTRAEKSAFRKIATEWVKLGRWCVSKELGEQARLCADKAQVADSSVFGLETLREKAEKCPDAADNPDNRKILDVWSRKLTTSSRKIAGYYD